MSVVVFMLHGFGFFATPLASAQNDINIGGYFYINKILFEELRHSLP